MLLVASSSEVVVVDILSFFGSVSSDGNEDGDLVVLVSGFSIFSQESSIEHFVSESPLKLWQLAIGFCTLIKP